MFGDLPTDLVNNSSHSLLYSLLEQLLLVLYRVKGLKGFTSYGKLHCKKGCGTESTQFYKLDKHERFNNVSFLAFVGVVHQLVLQSFHDLDEAYL